MTNIMTLETLNSSVIKAAGYDRDESVMRVEFISGRLYDYTGVPQSIYEKLLRAASAGEYFNANIRDRYISKEIKKKSPV